MFKNVKMFKMALGMHEGYKQFFCSIEIIFELYIQFLDHVRQIIHQLSWIHFSVNLNIQIIQAILFELIFLIFCKTSHQSRSLSYFSSVSDKKFYNSYYKNIYDLNYIKQTKNFAKITKTNILRDQILKSEFINFLTHL